MHRNYKILFILLIALFFTSVDISAQHTKCNIIGTVLDENQEPISYVSVAIYSEKPVAGVVTDNDGLFSLNVPQSDNTYRLTINFVGYAKYETKITPNRPNINLGTITLNEQAITLGEVEVTAKEMAQKSAIEHTTINAASNHASSKGSAIDILRASSAVTIANDEISIRGNNNVLVLIDGIPTTVSDLSTIPAVNIKNIDIITNPDASHDADGTGGIINIVSKKSTKQGWSGMVSANYGFNHFANGNIALSYNTAKTSWRFSYNSKYEEDVITSTLDRHIKSTGHHTFQQMEATRYTFNNNISLGADFRFNPKNRLNIDLKCIIPRLNIEQELHNTLTNNGSIQEENRFNDVTWNRENIDASITYTHIIKPEISDFTIKGSVSKIWGHRPSYYSVDAIPTNHSVAGGSPFIPSVQADYKHKFNKGTLSSGIKLTYRRNDIYHQFYTMENGDWVISDYFSNDLLHTELVPAAYAMYASRINKKWAYKVGLRGEFSSVTLNSSHESIDERNNSFFLAPSLSSSYTLNSNNEFALAFSRRIGRPTYPQLNPYMSMIDATTYEQGNMYLRPEKATKFDLSYNFRNNLIQLFANGYINYTNDYISQITTLNDDILVTTYINADSDIKTGLDLSLKIAPAKWANLSIGANTYYVAAKGIYEGANINNYGWTNNSNVMLNLNPFKSTDIQLQYFITTPQYFPQLTTSFTHQMNIGIKQQLLKKSLTLSLLVTDVFNTYKWEVTSYNNIFDLTNMSKGKSRMLWLGASYNFNSFKQKTGQKSEIDRSLIRIGL